VLRIRHEYKNGGSVELQFFVVDEFKGEVVNRIFKDIQWANRRDLASFDFLEADLRLLEGLSAGKIVSAKVLT
jgi:8-oxo-dGTP diphosphatase